MVLGAIGVAGAVPGAGDAFLTGVTDLCVADGPDGPVLYVTSGPGGGLSAYAMEAGGLRLLDRLALPAAGTAGVEGSLACWDGMVGVTGIGGAGLWAAGTDGQGGFAGRATLGGAALPTDLLDATAVTVGGTEFLYGLRLGSGSVSAWRVEPDGALAAVSNPNPSRPASGGPVLTDLAHVARGGADFLVAASAADDALVSFRVAPNGVPQEVDRLGAADGVPVDGPAAVAAVAMGGRSFVVMASSGTGTLTVFEVGTDGALSVADHVMDDLHARFAGATAVEAVVVDGRAFVAAAGSDDGVTLFELLPGGRLLLLDAVEDGTGVPLANVSALALDADGGTLTIVAASGSEPGLARLVADLPDGGGRWDGDDWADTLTGGAGDDLLSGLGGSDTLRGGEGRDVFMDGTGSDVMTGGTGEDVFVLAADGALDTIADFDPARDRIDLSGWRLLRSAAQLVVTATPTGAEIRFGDEVLRVNSASGGSIPAATILGLDLLGVSRMLPAWTAVVLPPLNLAGGAGADTLAGATNPDTIWGNGGDDSLTGGFGDDTVYGGDGRDRVAGGEDDDAAWGGPGADSLWGGAGLDRLYGDADDDWAAAGDGDDLLWGQAGNDALHGENGRDTLYGGDGLDTLDAGAGDDAPMAGAGNDRAFGGAGLDRLSGNDGNDALWGGTEGDILWGDGGNDTANGEAGADSLYGGDGGDTLNGGDDADEAWGGVGNDTVMGGNGDDRLRGEPGADSLNGGAGRDTAWGQDGDDRLAGGEDADWLWGGPMRDSLWGDGGDDALYGEGGDDAAYASIGNDAIWAGDGNDRLWGEAGDDICRGEAGNDSVYGGDGRDALWGGLGLDRLDGGAGNDQLVAEAGDDLLWGQVGNDGLYGGDGRDSAYGGDGADMLQGLLGNDLLYGEAGNDWIYGGDGVDTLWGGDGNDTLLGGLGADSFVFAKGSDRVADFGNDVDTLLLDNAMWSGRALTIAQVLGYASVQGPDTVFVFPGGQRLVVAGLGDPGQLTDDIVVI